MEDIINIEYPRSLADSLKMSESEFKKEVKVSAIVKLYEMNKITSGTAATILGLSRIEFIELLSTYKVSIFEEYDKNALLQDIKKNEESSHNFHRRRGDAQHCDPTPATRLSGYRIG